MESMIKGRELPCSLTANTNNTTGSGSYTLSRKYHLELIDNQITEFEHSLKEVTYK